MPKLINTGLYNDFKASYFYRARAADANRWLSEFNWLLAPMWEYMKDESCYGGISNARDKMRAALKKFQLEQIPEINQRKLLVIEEKLKSISHKAGMNLRSSYGTDAVFAQELKDIDRMAEEAQRLLREVL